MTEQQRTEELYKIGKLIKRLLPDYHGYIQFNLMPERNNAMVTRHETLVEKVKI